MSKINISPAKLDQYLNLGMNVLLVGKHGVGKTAMVIDAAKRNNLKFKYFSASTMDPWVDLVGIPQAMKDEETGHSYMDLLSPRQMEDVELVFLDEFNRAPRKVLNAAMELIQFRQINGKPFPKLKAVWTAINPDDEEGTYHVERLDPAQLDRFHVHLDVPYTPDEGYFTEKFGENLAKPALVWWHEIGNESKEDKKARDRLKDQVTPRRLDYALTFYKNGGDIRDILPAASNPNKLLQQISQKGQTLEEEMAEIMKKKDKEAGKKFLRVENKYNSVIEGILSDKKKRTFFLPLMEHEKLSLLLSQNHHNEVIECLQSEDYSNVNEGLAPFVKSVFTGTDQIITVRRIMMAVNEQKKLHVAGKKAKMNLWRFVRDECSKVCALIKLEDGDDKI